MKGSSSRFSLVLAALMLVGLVTPAFAWDCNYWEQHSNPNAECYKPPGDPGSSSSASSEASATAKQSQDQGQAQGQQQGQGQSQNAAGGNAKQGQGQSQEATGGDANQGQSQSADNNNDVDQSTSFNSTYTEIRQPVHTAIGVAGMNTMGCLKTWGAGLQLVAVGGSASFPRTDKDCTLERAADREYAKGNKHAGDMLTCRTSYMKAIYERPDLCIAGQNELVPVKREDGSGTDYKRIEAQKAQTKSTK